VLYHTIYTSDVDGGIMITGSHNPPNHNGFKICLGEETLFGERIQEIKKIALSGRFAEGSGNLEPRDVLENYCKDLISKLKPGQRPLKIVIDAGNGMGGVTAVPVYRRLGIEVVELFTNPDPSFPNHPPDPAAEENLRDLIFAVADNRADLGIAFDGDADRITVVDERGRIVWGDELTTLFAREVLGENPGGTVIGEVKCSQVLFDEVERLGGKAVMCKAGHSIVKAGMKQTGALLAGEMSGHIFFADRYYGFDDACYAGGRIIEILSRTERTMSELLFDLPQTFSTPEIRRSCREEEKFEIVRRLAKEFLTTNEVSTIDGARIKFENGWGLVRPSNTQAILVLRFEANSKENLLQIQKEVEIRLEKILREVSRRKNEFDHSHKRT
ncbi:MAG: phosphomannomutase/phosphoglucomutase, partial [Acidobacteria bacterium]|nr:phosphomannomutase/phosphoglucomutase [Acidobacteriota bacterium]